MTNTKQTQDDKTIQPFNCSTIQHIKAYAFTLAETLIVIGIIGVVAALTLPNLNHATGDKEKVTKVKKIYASLTDAFDRAQAVYGDYDTWFTDLYNSDGYVDPSNWATKSERMAKRITEFMKVSKDCKFGEGCFSSNPVLFYDGSVDYENDFEFLEYHKAYMLSLPDGTSLAFTINNVICVDIDGPNKGKNQDGVDRFHFSLQQNDLCPDYCIVSDWAYDMINTDFDEYGFFTRWVIEKDNLDYLKCSSELHWNTQTSCK